MLTDAKKTKCTTVESPCVRACDSRRVRAIVGVCVCSLPRACACVRVGVCESACACDSRRGADPLPVSELSRSVSRLSAEHTARQIPVSRLSDPVSRLSARSGRSLVSELSRSTSGLSARSAEQIVQRPPGWGRGVVDRTWTKLPGQGGWTSRGFVQVSSRGVVVTEFTSGAAQQDLPPRAMQIAQGKPIQKYPQKWEKNSPNSQFLAENLPPLSGLSNNPRFWLPWG